MGLAVSQVRLLALTTRKADIELQMQVDSKRKQMLTRKSTELAQQYYSKLQDSNIQYATTNGYEDVNYNYLMGQSVNGNVTSDFLSQVATGSDYNIAQKIDNRMILTDQYGQVVLNNQLSISAAKAKDDNQAGTIAHQTAYAIYDLIQNNKSNATMSALYNKLHGVNIGDEEALRYMEIMIKNGGFKNGGTIYIVGPANTAYTTTSKFTNSAEKAKSGTANLSEADYITPQAGYTYSVLDCMGKKVADTAGNFYDGTTFCALTQENAKYLGNLVSYFAPIISAALQNGFTATVDKNIAGNFTEKTISGSYTYGSTTVSIGTDGKANTDDLTQLKNLAGNKLRDGECGTITDKNGVIHYYTKSGGAPREIKSSEYYTYSIADDGNKVYNTAQNTERLQAGFKSGTFQLCMVSDANKGIYHKNTTMEYFVHMNYVVDKTDSSKREEITAWFNAEQAAISEQETYWDTEIQNLSTELNSVTTEIDSVKSLKSNAIKSVFDWGSS
ncbi:MAG: hypothetical protein NC200_05180 [Candidatus Gastranaerophilales bacterium]|nr:hypothetical protein [Candidatus Gastranaerophilales bacterium]